MLVWHAGTNTPPSSKFFDIEALARRRYTEHSTDTHRTTFSNEVDPLEFQYCVFTIRDHSVPFLELFSSVPVHCRV